MKKIFAFITLLVVASWQLSFVSGQGCYWVLLTDKAGTTFDPYSYFDSKAIERYRLNNADLYDISNYPLNESYVEQVRAIVEKDNSDDVHFAVNSPHLIGQSRWFNAVAVMATEEQIAAIEKLPFVLRTDLIASGMEVTEYMNNRQTDGMISDGHQSGIGNTKAEITDQLKRMQGELFVEKGIDGTGVRIAVFDGGFHAVNTHAAFKHLRDNGLIKATWNFTTKEENVYDNHSHGTMVLSCIAGRMGDKQLGLATGAEFLLAKTEVDPEPFKEEVWWAQAAEWADKNGADIINSSLGYTKDRHFTWEMDGRSYVAKAANMAANKGILVCNSAGNSGSDENWKIIGTPADAEDIISVGGIAPSLTTYRHIDFSSYGPTADGRMKPNVCAFGYAEVADTHNDTATTFAAGTSFSSPLTAGFSACAWQVMKGELKNAREMMSMIEQSGDLYPYYDYALGYGVPQASYFLDEEKRIAEPLPTFFFDDKGKYLLIHLNTNRMNPPARLDFLSLGKAETGAAYVVMFKIQDRMGKVARYVNMEIKDYEKASLIAIPKASLLDYDLVVHVNGFTNSYRLSESDRQYLTEQILYNGERGEFEYHVIDSAGYFKRDYTVNSDLRPAGDWYINMDKSRIEAAMMAGYIFGPGHEQHPTNFAFRFALRGIRNIRRWYGLGIGIEVGAQEYYYFEKDKESPWDTQLGLGVLDNVDRKNFEIITCNLELFQRIRLTKGKKRFEKGLHWDLGVFGGIKSNSYSIRLSQVASDNASSGSVSYNDVKPADKLFDWGFTTRFVWEWIGIYGRLRMSQPDIGLPRFELGIQLSI